MKKYYYKTSLYLLPLYIKKFFVFLSFVLFLCFVIFYCFFGFICFLLGAASRTHFQDFGIRQSSAPPWNVDSVGVGAVSKHLALDVRV